MFFLCFFGDDDARTEDCGRLRDFRHGRGNPHVYTTPPSDDVYDDKKDDENYDDL